MEEEKIQVNDNQNSNKERKLAVIDLYGTCIHCPDDFSLIKDIEKEIAEILSKYPGKNPKQVYRRIRNIIEKNPVDIKEPIIIEDGKDTIKIPLSQGLIERIEDNISRILIYDDVLEGIEYLKSKGYEIAVASNLARIYETPLRNGTIPAGTFKYEALSCEIGDIKPNPGVFEYLKKVSGINYDKMIVIGDRFEFDIRGANNVGIKKRFLITRPIKEEDKEKGGLIEQKEKDGIEYTKILNLKRSTLEQLEEIL